LTEVSEGKSEGTWRDDLSSTATFVIVGTWFSCK
jgi:hypothetical protein